MTCLKKHDLPERKDVALSAYTRIKPMGFTLIELLVVIAIIAILAAMLMPALAQARDRGKAASCQNNMKTLESCSQQYGDQFDDYVLPSDPKSMPGKIDLSKIFGTVPAAGGVYGASNVHSAFFNVFKCLKYLSNYNTASYCPKDSSKRDTYWGATTYGIVSVAAYPWRGEGRYYWWRYNKVHNPSKKIHFTEGQSQTPGKGYCRIRSQGSGPSTGEAAPYNWHGNETTVGFIDGHVESIYRVDWTYNNSLWHLVNDEYMTYGKTRAGY
ncbi:MAG: prepilin-type N-terminal cleavage/methylation domain-containing protein [Lentisphaeria bacterium]|nr:prepilin-type N-terminal cleavage/methylation domain-containing protein [Lentisphaeria bacterium]